MSGVTFVYVAGYTGMMVAYGCVVWGPPATTRRTSAGAATIPGYYPYPRMYGMGAWYNPWTGAYGRAAGVYGPYGGVTAAARYNPRTGRFSAARPPMVLYGGRAAAQAYNPRTGTYASTRQGSNVYGNWGSSYVQRGDDWAQTSRVTNRATGNDDAGHPHGRGWHGEPSRRSRRRRLRGRRATSGNVYAGHDGNVYKRQEGGGWQKFRATAGGPTLNDLRKAPPQGTERPAQGGGTRERPATTRPQRNPDAAALGHDWPARSRPRRAHRRRRRERGTTAAIEAAAGAPAAIAPLPRAAVADAGAAVGAGKRVRGRHASLAAP